MHKMINTIPEAGFWPLLSNISAAQYKFNMCLSGIANPLITEW